MKVHQAIVLAALPAVLIAWAVFSPGEATPDSLAVHGGAPETDEDQAPIANLETTVPGVERSSASQQAKTLDITDPKAALRLLMDEDACKGVGEGELDRLASIVGKDILSRQVNHVVDKLREDSVRLRHVGPMLLLDQVAGDHAKSAAVEGIAAGYNQTARGLYSQIYDELPIAVGNLWDQGIFRSSEKGGPPAGSRPGSKRPLFSFTTGSPRYGSIVMDVLPGDSPQMDLLLMQIEDLESAMREELAAVANR